MQPKVYSHEVSRAAGKTLQGKLPPSEASSQGGRTCWLLLIMALQLVIWTLLIVLAVCYLLLLDRDRTAYTWRLTS